MIKNLLGKIKKILHIAMSRSALLKVVKLRSKDRDLLRVQSSTVKNGS